MTQPTAEPIKSPLLSPGIYWFELEFLRPTSRDSIVHGLSAIGVTQVKFEAPIVLPALVRMAGDPNAEWCQLSRFLGTIEKDLRLVSRVDAEWKQAVKVPFDPRDPVSPHGVAVPIRTGKTYFGRILSRETMARTRGDVTSLLEGMGFDDPNTFLMKQNQRLPGKPNASLSEWLFEGVWARPDSITTIEEPFFFERLSETS